MDLVQRDSPAPLRRDELQMSQLILTLGSHDIPARQQLSLSQLLLDKCPLLCCLALNMLLKLSSAVLPDVTQS